MKGNSTEVGPRHALVTLMVAVWVLSLAMQSYSHDVGSSERVFLETLTGAQPFPYMYLGAKHMVTGYDHLLYLVGVVFFLVRPRDVLLYVSLFAVGHSITLVSAVLAGIELDGRPVDALIGLSVAYKAIENLGGFRACSSRWLDPRIAVFCFGLIHGLGLATRLQSIAVDEDGLLTNLVAFNVGVEIGQILALFFALLLLSLLRRMGLKQATEWPNILLMAAGFVLFAIHGYDYLFNP